MTTLKNTSPFGDLDVPALGRIVPAGETVEVDDNLVAHTFEGGETVSLVQSLVDGTHFEFVEPEEPEQPREPEEGADGESAPEGSEQVTPGADTGNQEIAPQQGAGAQGDAS